MGLFGRIAEAVDFYSRGRSRRYPSRDEQVAQGPDIGLEVAKFREHMLGNRLIPRQFQSPQRLH